MEWWNRSNQTHFEEGCWVRIIVPEHYANLGMVGDLGDKELESERERKEASSQPGSLIEPTNINILMRGRDTFIYNKIETYVPFCSSDDYYAVNCSRAGRIKFKI
jgi:hypothetical protein